MGSLKMYRLGDNRCSIRICYILIGYLSFGKVEITSVQKIENF